MGAGVVDNAVAVARREWWVRGKGGGVSGSVLLRDLRCVW